MQIKKSRELNLERKKPTFFLLGLAVACAIVLSAFEWRTTDLKKSSTDDWPEEVPIFEATIIPPSFREKEKPLEKKKDTQKEVAKAIIDRFKFEEIDPLKNEFPEIPDLEEPVFKDIAPVAEPTVEEEPLRIADVMPQFPGGDSARVAFLSNNVIYPRIAKDAGISGTVHIEFTVTQDGSLADIQIIRGAGAGLDEEALKAVLAMPKWKPGFDNGRPVSVRFVMPVTFRLR